MNRLKCAICGEEIIRKETDTWCFHTSFPGPVHRHHPGVEDEWNRLFNEANERLKKELEEE